jgi:hypothetical protein
LGHSDSRDQPNNWEKDAHFTNRHQSRLEYDWHCEEPVSWDLLGGRCDGAQASLVIALTLGGGIERGPRGRRDEHANASERVERFPKGASLGSFHGEFFVALFFRSQGPSMASFFCHGEDIFVRFESQDQRLSSCRLDFLLQLRELDFPMRTGYSAMKLFVA